MPKQIRDIYFFMVILYSGMALTMFRNHEGLIALWLIGLLIFRRETYYTHPNLLISIGVWMTYFVVNALSIGSFHPFFMFTYIAKIMIAYWLLTFYRETVFHKFENIVYFLTIIALFFYVIQLLFPQSLSNLFESIDLSQNLFPNRDYSSIGIYTYRVDGTINSFPRNPGFAWEPGPFSCYLALAIFINIARNNVRLRDKKRLFVYTLALISTQSTTGFIALLAIIMWYAWERSKKKATVIISVPIVSIIILVIFINVPWLQQKIIIESNQDVTELLSEAAKSKNSYAPGRFASLQLRWEDFKNYPLSGFGGNTTLEKGYLGKDNIVAAISGIGNIFGRYGIIGSVIFIWLILASGRFLSRKFFYDGFFIFPLLILIIGFSFGIIESPIIFTMWMTPVFLHNNSRRLLIKK